MKRLLFLALLTFATADLYAAKSQTLLNTSYDVTREFYQKVNVKFIEHYEKTKAQKVKVNQSHGGSSKQARAVVDGLDADVASFNQSTDIDILVNAGLVAKNWREQFPHQASPYTSTILFMVRKGNPKNIKDWDDLVRQDVQVIIPHPKTSGNGRYSYVAAWAYALKHHGNEESKARDFVQRLFKNVPVLDAGGRGATNSFAQNDIGDVLLTLENEVHLTQRELKDKGFEVVIPSLSIVADAPIAVIDQVAKKRGTEALAKEYLNFLFTDEVQELAAQSFFRPSNANILSKHTARFPSLELVTVDEIVGGWAKAYAVHFNDGGVFDQIYNR